MKIVRISLLIVLISILASCNSNNEDFANIDNFEYYKVLASDDDSFEYEGLDKSKVEDILELINEKVVSSDHDAISKIDSAKTLFELHLKKDDDLIRISIYLNYDGSYTLGYLADSKIVVKEKIYNLDPEDKIILEYLKLVDAIS
jgi:hypothetical protein